MCVSINEEEINEKDRTNTYRFEILLGWTTTYDKIKKLI